MVRLDILSGKMAGEHWLARHLPVHIGRQKNSDLQLEENGVWDQHVTIRLANPEGFILEAQPNALVTLNGETVRSARLRNGDTIGLGSVKFQFRLTAPRQRMLWLREWFLWLLVAAVAAAEILLVYRVLE